jgi:hypothetical protein
MNQRRSLSSPDPFFRIRLDLERWRRHRVSGDRIPDRLWAAAVDLAELRVTTFCMFRSSSRQVPSLLMDG